MTRTQRHIEEFRQGNHSIQVRDAAGRPCAGIPIWVEQESHEFPFGCAHADLSAFSDSDRERYRQRLGEVFNCLVPAGAPPAPEVLRVDAAERVHLGLFRRRLDQLGTGGHSLEVHVWGATVGMIDAAESTGLGDREAGARVAELYTLCFGHPAVSGVFWNGLADGESGARGGGLLRRDLAPKYAHKVLRKLIGLLWHGRAAGVTDAAGTFQFRGFFGDYRVGVQLGEPITLVDTIALHFGNAGNRGEFVVHNP